MRKISRFIFIVIALIGSPWACFVNADQSKPGDNQVVASTALLAEAELEELKHRVARLEGEASLKHSVNELSKKIALLEQQAKGTNKDFESLINKRENVYLWFVVVTLLGAPVLLFFAGVNYKRNLLHAFDQDLEPYQESVKRLETKSKKVSADFSSRLESIHNELEQAEIRLRSFSESEAYGASSKIYGYLTEVLWAALDDNEEIKEADDADKSLLLPVQVELTAKKILYKLSWEFLKKGYDELTNPLNKAQIVANLLFYLVYSKPQEKFGTEQLVAIERHCATVEQQIKKIKAREGLERADVEHIETRKMLVPQIELSILYVKYHLKLLNPTSVREEVTRLAEFASPEDIEDIERDFKGINWRHLRGE